MPVATSVSGADSSKKLAIKTNTIKRYGKDLEYYEKELTAARAKYNELSAQSDCCPYVLKQQGEIVKETETMLPSCQTRLQAARADLQVFLDEHEPDSFADASVLAEAQRLVNAQ